MNFFQQLQEFRAQANQIEDLRLRSEAWIYCNLTGQPPSKRDFTQSQTSAQSAFSTWAISNFKKGEAQRKTPFRPFRNEKLGHYILQTPSFPSRFIIELSTTLFALLYSFHQKAAIGRYFVIIQR